MASEKFQFTSEQLELLLAFEDNGSLAQMAEFLGRDPSVVSRGLQKLAENFPVLEKVKGRWELTPLGRKLNELTREFVGRLNIILDSNNSDNFVTSALIGSGSVLIVINAQKGLLGLSSKDRSNSEAEINISKLLKFWRTHRLPLIHIKHLSNSPSSMFHQSSVGSEFLSELSPANDEIILEKTKSSAFFETPLVEALQAIDPKNLVLVGFTANDCIDATARDSSALGFLTYVVGDATATFDIKGTNGKTIRADRLQELTLANINALYARVVQTKDII